MLLSSFTFWAQDDQYVFRECSCDCDDLIPTSNDIVLKGIVTNEFREPIWFNEVTFNIGGFEFEGKTNQDGEYQILITDFHMNADSIFFKDEFIGFEQGDVTIQSDTENFYQVDITNRIRNHRVMGGVLKLERKINIFDSKIVTIYSEEIRYQPRK